MPAASPVVSLRIEPAGLTLDGPKSREQLLVTGVRKDGTLVDLTAHAKYTSKTPKTAVVSSAGIVQPVSDGPAKIAVSAAGKTTQASVTVKNARAPFTWSFNNHVISVFSKAGCNMGACHGAAAGKNGFRLTLRGYDPDLDYDRLLHESGGRR
ncbi:MAG TPA: hypothetical protein VFU47_13270, partial [Armatimonadota bacterium]|nr:hypothetical protein [Armatimonadota bacterium]